MWGKMWGKMWGEMRGEIRVLRGELGALWCGKNELRGKPQNVPNLNFLRAINSQGILCYTILRYAVLHDAT